MFILHDLVLQVSLDQSLFPDSKLFHGQLLTKGILLCFNLRFDSLNIAQLVGHLFFKSIDVKGQIVGKPINLVLIHRDLRGIGGLRLSFLLRLLVKPRAPLKGAGMCPQWPSLSCPQDHPCHKNSIIYADRTIFLLLS